MKTYDLVLKLLKEQPELRDSDKKLIWAVWQYQGVISKEKGLSLYDFIDVCISPESIRRCRQKIQETTKELEATKRVKEMRKVKEKQKGTYIYRESTDSYYFQPAE